MSSESAIVVAALYKFTPWEDFAQWRLPLRELMESSAVRGTLLLAHEGINGTIAGSRAGVDQVLDHLRNDDRFADLEVKESYCHAMPFRRTRVRLKQEIVTMGVTDIDPRLSCGTYVDPQDWNALIEDPEVTLIDTRNDYEVAIGSFRGAINPETQSFRQFPDWVREHLDPKRHRKVAMYCTGGIRCEKSTALLREMGFEQVYHLRGGILKYLEVVPEQESHWQGDCFVFDGRVSVGHGLTESDHVMCFGCGWPVTAEQQRDARYIPGVQCPNCADKLTDEQRQRFAERQRQMTTADVHHRQTEP